MSQNDDTTAGVQPRRSDTGRPLGSLGSAEVRIDVDPDTYERLRAEYRHAVAHGYSDGFETFAYNYCSLEHRVEVEGEPVDPDADVDGGE